MRSRGTPDGNVASVAEACESCNLVRRREQGNAPLWDDIYRTSGWAVAHAYNTSLLGWTVLALRRHIESLADLTTTEAAEMGDLIQRISTFQRQHLNTVKSYVMGFAEHPLHPHVHLHVVPRAADMPESHRSVNVFRYLETETRQSEAAMNEYGENLRAFLIAGSG